MAHQTGRGSIKHRAYEELTRFALITAYLFVFLAAISIYRSLLLAEFGVHYAQVGYIIVEAMLLAKVVMLGDILRLGERTHGWPLAATILCKTLAFALLVFVFGMVEHIITGRIHGQTASEVMEEAFVTRRYATLAHLVLLFIAFVPFFALREIGRALGEGRLMRMLFSRERDPTPPAAG